MRFNSLLPLVILAGILVFSPAWANADNIWDLEAVNPDGTGSHPKVGASPTNASNKVIIQGIALNSPGEILDTNLMWQVYVQAEPPDQGGIAAWAGIFYNSSWPRYPEDIMPGDRIRIEGFITDHNGKVNINERHSADPSLQFVVTKLEEDVGMPEPRVISDLSSCNYFDQTRQGGGEHFQNSWVLMENVHIVSGMWGSGNTLLLSDDSGSTIPMLLSSEGDFDDKSMPQESFSVIGIFDQEDTDSPYHEDYRLWVKKYSDIILPLGAKFWEEYE